MDHTIKGIAKKINCETEVFILFILALLVLKAFYMADLQNV